MSFFSLHKKNLIRALCVLLALLTVASLVVLFIENARGGSVRGGRDVKDANLRFLTAEEAENGLRLHFRFLSGTGENAVPCGVPRFHAELLPAPVRLKVTFDALSYDDYVIDGTPEDPSGLFFALFRAAREDGTTTFYFHLSEYVSLRAEESDELVLTLTRTGKAQESAYYLLSDTYYDYLTGAQTDKSFTPTLCDDYASVFMISAPYATRSAAESARDKMQAGNGEQTLRVISLDAGNLPSYADSVDAASLLSESILSVNGSKTSLPLFFADARFLCWLPDQSGALFAREENGSEHLYVADKSGMRRALTPQGFATVVKARFSSDGRLLAFVEQAEDTELITLVTVETGEVSVLDGAAFEMPMGNTIMDLALNEDGSKLYCLSGDAIYSLREYDLVKTTAVMLDPDVLVESGIEYRDGYLYYCDVFDEVEAIMRTETETNEEEVVARGAVFTMSPDGRYLAYMTEDYATAVKDLNITDLTDMTSVTVAQDVVTDEFFFDADSASLYYMPQSDDAEFCYQILRFDIAESETATLAQSVNAVFFASDKAHEIIICVINQNGESASPATYLADFLTIKVGEDE